MTATCVLFVTFRAELGLLAADRSADQRQKSRSVGRYGATRGLDRVLQVLADHRAPATWFVPTAAIDLYPQQAERIAQTVVDAGHELACAGRDLTNRTGRPLAEQTLDLLTSRDILATRLGITPVGYRICTGEPHPDLADTLAGQGFTWSSCLRGDDRPYRHPSGLVELPRHHELDDDAYFAFNLDPPLPAGAPRIASVGDVAANWGIEFAAYRAEGLCFALDLHTDLIGTPARAAMLSQLLDHICATDQVEILTAAQAATRCLPPGSETELPTDHPLLVFARERAAYLQPRPKITDG